MTKTNVVFFEENSILSYFTHFFTGCKTYHVGFWYDGYMYEMSITDHRRKRFIGLLNKKNLRVYECPVDIDLEYHEKMLANGNKYSIKDLILFVFYPFKRFIKRRDHSGLICSEMVNEDLLNHGWNTPWRFDVAPPSPCELVEYFENHSRIKRIK